MMAAPGVTRTPSGRIRRIPSDLMKRVRCAYPGCDLAVIPSNFARHWKFKHTDMPQPPIESLTVVRGDNTSETGDVIWPHILKPPPPEPIKTQPTPHLRVDGKERKRARQRNYICPECHRPLIGSNFGRHWASKHPHITQPSLINLEMEALSGGEEDLAPPDPLSITSSPKPTVKKRKVVCRECEMPMINSNFSRHWASRHPHLDMPLLSELEVIDVEVDASPPLKKPHKNPVIHQSHMPITIPYPSDDGDGDHLVQDIEPADEEFEDLEEIEDEDEDVMQSRTNLEYDLIDNDYDEEDIEEVTVEPVHYSNGLSGGDKGGPQFGGGFGGKRHKKVYCPECNMPMLCNNFRRHFHRRHGDIAHRMPSIHSLKLVPDEEYEMAQINKVVPPYNNPPHHHKNKELSSFPEVQTTHLLHTHPQ
ncbi:unnamed protein product [Lepeophtheirus salmonis]|uniref:(salmon louse) hypothetical protein n=1 Tax=Lepeophtheirus salmonis TaxID=72036 RepID=A0A7R8D0T1_LEPSM|nr:unnamed protein product [Lepeophtheirus salmonis]CAF2985238.1 unnamed protein product [Lepeophtheirus salmonis]